MVRVCYLLDEVTNLPQLSQLTELLRAKYYKIVVHQDKIHQTLIESQIEHQFLPLAEIYTQIINYSGDKLNEIVILKEKTFDISCITVEINIILRKLAIHSMIGNIFMSSTELLQYLNNGVKLLSKEKESTIVNALKYCNDFDAKVLTRFEERGTLIGKRVLVIGSGGREHALVSKLAQSDKVSHVFSAPGNSGTGIESSKCSNVAIASDNIPALVDYAVYNKIDLVVVGPEQPLVDGIVDSMAAKGIPCFGPNEKASIVESSKAWSKDFMNRNNIRTAEYKNFTTFSSAKTYIESVNHRVVVKASGLAAGKGVLIPLTKEEAIEGAKSILEDKVFGEAGCEIVIEEFLEGEEVSVLAFSDGSVAKGMPPAQDHKRVFDNDQGLNTGGMGAYAPTPLINGKQYDECMEIVQRSVEAMAKEGRPFVGVLYAGFIVTKSGPVVLEYNCRFGDPETEVLLPLLKTDLYDIIMACVEGQLTNQPIEWMDGAACTVVCAAPGYPETYPKGSQIFGLDKAATLPSVKVFHAGAKSDNGKVLTNGGRVLTVTGTGKNLLSAVQNAYNGVNAVSFDGMHFRKDIAKRGLTKPVKLGVIGSTRGTVLQVIIDAIAAKELNAEVSLVISNKSSAYILERATNNNIPSLHISAVNKTREEYDAEVCKAFDEAGVELVLMIGYMRIVSPYFCNHFSNRCLNVHPSLLPDFAGGMDLEVHSAVIAAKKPKSGCTVHFVTEEVDGGPIVVQLSCDVEYPTETAESLKAKVQALEGKAFLEAIELFRTNSIDLSPKKDVITYRSAGVDIDAGEALVDAIKGYCKGTKRAGCDADLGGFGGLFDLSKAGYDSHETILVSGTDGVGTKLKIAQTVHKHDTIGIDLVAMCVNDVLVCGAEPLFFLDYYATGALNVEEAAQVVKGIAEGCAISGSALIGGETAEMAGMYSKGEYDLAGFSVGAVRKSDMLPRKDIMSGDVLIGLPSSGVHSNGYSLVRKCVERSGKQWTEEAPFLPGSTLAEALLTPTKIYVKELLPPIKAKAIKALAHITGGGLLDNLPRVLPDDLDAFVDIDASGWKLPPVFQWLQSIANLPQRELLRTFNCGIGMVLVVGAEDVERVLSEVTSSCTIDGRAPIILGKLIPRADPQATEQVHVKGFLA